VRFKTRDEFINAQSSEKLTMVHVHGKQRLYVFTGPSSNIYSKVVPYFVYELKQNDTYLTKVNSLVSIINPGQFYYDIKTSTIHVRPLSDLNPKAVEMIATYRFFYSDVGINCSWNFEDLSDEVFYDGRIKATPGYKHKIGIDQALTSLVGTGTLSLHCQDGDLDVLFDKIIFENQIVNVYSWNRDLKPSEAKIIYRGRVTNKSFDTNQLTLTVKDPIFELLQPPQNSVYSDLDNVSNSVKGQYKRLVYGRVDGLQCQSIDQIGDGFQLTGTLTASVAEPKLYGTGTQFLTQVFQGDKLTIDSLEFTVESIQSNTELTISNEPDYGFSARPGINSPKRGIPLKNRTYLATEHICTEQVKSIILVEQLNRVVLNDVSGLFPGDFIEFVSTGERIEIKNTAPGNIVVLRQNMINRPTPSTNAIRRPIQKVYINGSIVPAGDFNINNSSSCGITFSSNVEFNLAQEKSTAYNLNFTNGSRIVSYTGGGDIQISELLKAGDWIKPNVPAYTTYYKISYIDNNDIYLISNFTEATVSDTADYKSPDYLVDDTTISVDILGKTENGLASGVWISTIAQAERDLIRQINITEVNEQSFIDGKVDGNQLVSIAIPESFSGKSLPKVKDIVDKLNKSISSSLTLDNNLRLKFQVLNAFADDQILTISDYDVIDWSIQSTNGKIFNKVIAKYRFKDVGNDTLSEANNVYLFESEFVNRYIESGQLSEVSLYLYNETEAKINAHRNLYQNRLSVATIKVKSDLRLENLEIGDIVILDFKQMYRRLGADNVRKKVVLITGKTVTGEMIDWEMSDLGNTFNTSSYITPNTAPEYLLSSDDERLVYGYITDNQGIVENLEETAGVHLIS
jgi:hypothetical protein